MRWKIWKTPIMKLDKLQRNKIRWERFALTIRYGICVGLYQGYFGIPLIKTFFLLL